MNFLGYVDRIKLKNWCLGLKGWERERWYGREIKEERDIVWFGVGVELGGNSFFEGNWIGGSLKGRIDEIWGGEDWNSILVYKYGNGSKLNLHVDRDVFDKRVLIINSGICLFSYGGNDYWMEDGGIYEINGKVKHGVKRVIGERFSLSVRKVLG